MQPQIFQKYKKIHFQSNDLSSDIFFPSQKSSIETTKGM